MKREIKFTTDGKKVVVVGALNAQETIVQEIFIIDGSEIPSGEHFVTRSLHDAPAVSWKEKQLLKIETEYQTTYEQKKKELEVLNRDFDLQKAVVREKLSFLKKLQTTFSEDKLEQLVAFISGDIQFVVRENYGDLEIVEYNTAIASTDRGRFESLRLLSVFGRTDGDIAYKRNQYRDGSGSWDNIYPCKTKSEAEGILKEKFTLALDKGLSDTLLKVAQKYGLEIPEDKMEEYKAKKREAISSSIERQKEILTKLEEDLSQIK